MTSLIKGMGMNAAAYFLLALPIGILTAGVMNSPGTVLGWPINEQFEALLYVWFALALPLGMGFVVHQVGMLILEYLWPSLHTWVYPVVCIPLLFVWLLLPGVEFDPSISQAPSQVLVPLALGTLAFIWRCRPLMDHSAAGERKDVSPTR